jgi:hypothetical protein
MTGRRLSVGSNLRVQNTSQETTANKPQAQRMELPFWDSRKRTLFFRGEIVKEFRTSAGNQIKIIEKFSQEGWIDRIENPLSRHKNETSLKKLHQTLKRLNLRQKEARIRFKGDGTGRGILWYPATKTH